MFLTGKVKSSFIITFCVSFNLWAFDAGQHMPDQSDHSGEEQLQKSWSNSKDISPYLNSQAEDINIDDSSQSAFLPSKTEDQIISADENKEDSALPGSQENNEEYNSYTSKGIVSPLLNKGQGTYALNYFYDTFTYQDTTNVHKTSIEDDKRGKKLGTLLFTYDSYSRYKNLSFISGINAGVGLNKGRGFFNDGTRSETVFHYWMLPLEARLGFEVTLGRWGAISFSGGPGVMGLIQSRNDFEPKEKGKEKRQVSVGYFAGARVKISLSNLNYNKGLDLYSQYNISNYHLLLELRNQNYSSFKTETFSISGTSVGIGIAFDYL